MVGNHQAMDQSAQLILRRKDTVLDNAHDGLKSSTSSTEVDELLAKGVIQYPVVLLAFSPIFFVVHKFIVGLHPTHGFSE